MEPSSEAEDGATIKLEPVAAVVVVDSATAAIPPPSDSFMNSQLKQDILKLPKEIRNIFAGGLAGMIAKSVVAPFDRIKILYQISSAEFHIWKVPGVAKNIIKTEGLSALWKGNLATMIRVFPYSGIQFMVFDRCKTFLLKEQEREYRLLQKENIHAPKPRWGLSPLESLFSGMTAGAISVVCTYPLDLTRAQLAVLRRKKHEVNIGFLGTLRENHTKRVRNKQSSAVENGIWTRHIYNICLYIYHRSVV
jgi:hypothetical protein